MALHPHDAAKRQEIGDRFIEGEGVEIGAGLEQSRYELMRSVAYADKRSKAEVEAWFGSAIEYEVGTIDELRALRPSGYDFIVAHQVLEHAHEPISALATWVTLLRRGGLLYITVPDAENVVEADRLPTPLEHILDDFAFRRTADCYESRQHIGSFMAQMTKQSPGFFPETTDAFVEHYLHELTSQTEHDLHWHTFTADVLLDVVRCAFYFAGSSSSTLHVEVAHGALHVVCQKRPPRFFPPRAIRAHRARLRAGARGLSRSLLSRFLAGQR
jgi:SAM-dependent methyltransferase